MDGFQVDIIFNSLKELQEGKLSTVVLMLQLIIIPFLHQRRAEMSVYWQRSVGNERSSRLNWKKSIQNTK